MAGVGAQTSVSCKKKHGTHTRTPSAVTPPWSTAYVIMSDRSGVFVEHNGTKVVRINVKSRYTRLGRNGPLVPGNWNAVKYSASMKREERELQQAWMRNGDTVQLQVNFVQGVDDLVVGPYRIAPDLMVPNDDDVESYLLVSCGHRVPTVDSWPYSLSQNY